MDRPKTASQKTARIALFFIWLIVLMPIYTADALEVQFQVDDISTGSDSAVVSWTTDVDSTGIVRYGIDDFSEEARSDELKKEHEVELTGLLPSTQYQFQIVASDDEETQTIPAPDQGFPLTTGGAEDTTPPSAVEDLAVTGTRADSVSLSWDIDAEKTPDVDSYKVYRDGELLDTVKTKSYTDTEDIVSGTQYKYEVSAVDTSGNEGPKTSITATPGGAAKTITISGLDIEVIGTNVLITWETDIPSHSRIKYSKNPLLLDQKQETGEFVTEHNITLKNLEKDTTYTFIAESCDQQDNCGNSSAQTFTTSKETELFLDVEQLDCDPSTAKYHNSHRMDISGYSSPGADVTVYMNDERERYLRIPDSGRFHFGGVRLDADREENTIRLVADDRVGKEIECIEKILLDYYGPEVHFSNETLNLTVATNEMVKIEGTVQDNNPVTMYVYAKSVDDTTPPGSPENLKNTTIGKNSVTIGWDAVESSEATAVEGSVTGEGTESPAGTAAIGEDLPEIGGELSGFAVGELESAGPAEGSVTGSDSITGMQTLDAENDVLMYLIYRSDVGDGPIATVDHPTTSFTDNNVSTQTTYTYRVSAMDKAGNEGAKSSPLTVTTLSNGTTMEPRKKIVPKSPDLKVEKEIKTVMNQTKSFSESVSLYEGKNHVRVVFEDVAGNTFEESFDIVLDSEEPKILTPTASDLAQWYSPSFVSEINIEGQANKDSGEVWVFVNTDPKSKDAEPTEKATLGENGTFSVDVQLATTISGVIKGSFENQSTEAGVGVTGKEGTPTTIYLVAVDSYGRQSPPVQGSVIYKPCGEGNYFRLEIKPGGNIINTRELMEGVAAYGFGYELHWQGGGLGQNVTVSGIDVRKATVGTKEAEKYDFDWINNPQVTAPPKNRTKGFVMIPFKPQIVEGETYFDREKNLSQHRKGECWPWAGCIRLLLEMDIRFTSPELQRQYAAMTQGQAGTLGTASQIKAPNSQKTCVEIKIQLDERVDPSVIPKGLLRSTIEAINASLKVIEAIEKPLEYVSKITLGFCMLSFFSKMVLTGLRTYYCKYTSALSSLSKGSGGIAGLIKSGKMETIAKWDNGKEDGACAVEFGGEDGDDEAKAACQTCAKWIGKEKWVTDKWHLFCDRVTCPPVPTLQHFILEKYGKSGKPSPWRFVEAAAARAANQCLKNTPLVKTCICGMDKDAPTCKSGQLCIDGKCEDVQQCVYGKVVDKTCLCKTPQGALAKPPYCEPGTKCLPEGICKGVDEPTMESVTQATTTRSGEEKCKAKNQSWSCSCPVSDWPKSKCTEENNCVAGLCTGQFEDYRCCYKPELAKAAPGEEKCIGEHPGWSCSCKLSSKGGIWTEAKCKTSGDCDTGLCSGVKIDYYCCSAEAAQESAAPKWKDDWVGNIYSSPTQKGAEVKMVCPTSDTCMWKINDASKDYPAVKGEVIKVTHSDKVRWYATQDNGQVWECYCEDYENAKKVLNKDNSNNCIKRTECKDAKECSMCQTSKTVPYAILGGESPALPETQDSDSSGMGLITGMQTGKNSKETPPSDSDKIKEPAEEQTAKDLEQTEKEIKAGTSSTPSQSGSSSDKDKPIYNRVIPYEKKGMYKDPNFINAKSDCEFAQLGRDQIQEMWEFYNEGDAEEKKKCEEGHIFQAACCPFEYMQEWGWGMMYQNEMKLSYCLSNPEASECETGEDITTGVTGICAPKASAKRSTPVTLDGLKYKKGYPVRPEDMYNDKVVYLVNIDEKGSAKSVRRGYYTKAEVRGTVGEVDDQGRVMISTGTYFKPLDGAKELSYAFPKRDDANPKLDEEGFKEGVEAFANDLCSDVKAGNIVPISTSKSKTNSLVIACDTFMSSKKITTPIEDKYREILNLLGEPHRQYLAQPASSFIDSLLTLCLSALLSWIQHYKNFANHLMVCLQTILVTGDGSAGQCRAIMGQYFCDILQQIISCISRRYGAGSGSRVGVGGFGGIFGSIYEASNTVIAEANDRYGNNNLFSTTFNAENLAYDACIFMFTGEWPTDWKSLFESASRMPINTSAWVFPVTRRWQAYDGNTGYARYVYRIGYTISAGAPIQYRLYLKASGSEKPECPNGEACDGSYVTAEKYQQRGRTLKLQIPHHQSGTCPDNGMLEQGASCTDEVLYVVEGPQAALRFDQAVLEWAPSEVTTAGPSGQQQFQGSMVSRESVSGAASGDVREIGGAPQGLCEFSISDLAFRCGVEIPPTGRARIISAEPVRPITEPLEVGEHALFKVQVSNELPKDAESCADQCTFTKYLVIDKILNQNNIEIYPPPGVSKVGEKINAPGVHDFVFMEPGQWPQTSQYAKPFEIKMEHFSAQRTQGARCLPQKTSLLATSALGNVDCTNANQVYIEVECNSDGKECKFRQVERITGKSELNPLSVWQDCEEKPPATIPDTYYTFKCNGITMTVNGKALKDAKKNAAYQKLKDEQKKFTFRVDNAPQASPTATAFQCTSTPVEWKAHVQLRETTETGGGFRMATGPLVDAETGEKQEKIINFKVVCKGTGRASALKTLSDLQTFTAKVQDDNTANNKTFGLWVDEYGLGPAEYITVGSFRWLNPRLKEEGFAVNIDAKAEKTVVLHMDVGSIGLIPTPDIYFQKGSTTLQLCEKAGNQPPCIHKIGDVNDRQIALLLAKGDPEFRMSGFKEVGGMSKLSGEITLSRDGWIDKSTGVALQGLTKSTNDTKLLLSGYRERDSGFSIDYKTEPGNLLDPIAILFNLETAGFDFTGSPLAISHEGTAISQCGDKPAGSGSGAFSQPAGELKSGDHACYVGDKDNNLIIIKTRGSGEIARNLNIEGLRKVETSILSTLQQASGQTLILTKERPSRYVFTGTGFKDEYHKLTIKPVLTGKTLTMDISNSDEGIEAGGTTLLTIETRNDKLHVTSNTKVEMAGPGGGTLPACGATPTQSCVKLRDVDRIVLSLKKTPQTKIRISGLSDASEAAQKCARKAKGESCGTNQVCYVPPIEGTGIECMSQCQVNYIRQELQKIIDTGRAPTVLEYNNIKKGEGGKFCVPSSYKCGTALLAGTGLCEGNNVCCPDGSGKPKPKVHSSGGNAVKSIPTFVPCRLKGETGVCVPENQCKNSLGKTGISSNLKNSAEKLVQKWRASVKCQQYTDKDSCLAERSDDELGPAASSIIEALGHNTVHCTWAYPEYGEVDGFVCNYNTVYKMGEAVAYLWNKQLSSGNNVGCPTDYYALRPIKAKYAPQVYGGTCCKEVDACKMVGGECKPNCADFETRLDVVTPGVIGFTNLCPESKYGGQYQCCKEVKCGVSGGKETNERCVNPDNCISAEGTLFEGWKASNCKNNQVCCPNDKVKNDAAIISSEGTQDKTEFATVEGTL